MNTPAANVEGSADIPVRHRLSPLSSILLATSLGCFLASAQTNRALPPVQDPMMSLMMAQPRIEFDAPVVAEASFDPPVVRPGELSIYRVSLNALEESVKWPSDFTGPRGLSLKPGGHGQVLQIAGTNMQARTTFNFRVKAEKDGVFTIPEHSLQAYGKPVQVPAARLTVAAGRPTGISPAQQLYVELQPGSNFYVGQAIKARLLMPGGPRGQIQFLTQVQFLGEGFISDQSSVRQTVRVMPLPEAASGSVPTLVYETTVTPLKAGSIEMFAQGFTAGTGFNGTMVITGPAVIPGGQPQYLLLDSAPLTLNVLPLPVRGKLPGFTGAIGRFRLDPLTIPTNALRTGDPFQLLVNIRGEGNLARLVPPPPPASRDWQVFPGISSAAPTTVQLSGFNTLQFTFIPLSDEVTETPEIPFSYFDPEEGIYRDLTIPRIPVEVEAGEVPVNMALLQQAAATSAKTNPEPVLSGLASTPGKSYGSLVPLQQRGWFFVVQLAPAVAVFSLLAWDRRRRWLELHPKIVLCRRARRALRRQRRTLRSAAHRGDSPAFAQAAVRALRIACAPHYPAEPRALVSTDVLPVLDEPFRSGDTGAAVQRVFACVDASVYSAARGGIKELLHLKPALDRALDHLETKLRT